MSVISSSETPPNDEEGYLKPSNPTAGLDVCTNGGALTNEVEGNTENVENVIQKARRKKTSPIFGITLKKWS